MDTSSDRPMEAAREGSGASISQPHALEGVGEHISNLINFEKMRKMGGVEFEGTVDPTDAEQWLDHMERVFEQLECSDVAKFKYAISLLQKDTYNWWVSVSNAKATSTKAKQSEFSTASTPNYGQGKSRVPTCPQCGKNHYGTCRRASGARFNCGSFDHKVKDCPNPNNAPSLRTEGSVHKPSVHSPQTNRGARPKNSQAVGTSGANQASGQRATARAYAMRQRDDQEGQDLVIDIITMCWLKVLWVIKLCVIKFTKVNHQ
uniref:Polyprotein n=1 Tax=Solanum tuberosum TaxID=4113 RepID=M1DMF5_SOLTU